MVDVTIVQELCKSLTYEDAAMLQRAYWLADTAHAGQKRADGSLYISHPLSVAQTFRVGSLLQIDYEDMFHLCTAGILHDTGEDSNIWGDRSHTFFLSRMYDSIQRFFNRDIAEMVVGVTRQISLPNVPDEHSRSRKSVNEEYLTRLSKASEKVRLLKLADIAHNITSAYDLPKDHKLRMKTKKNVEEYFKVLGSTPKYPREEKLYEKINRAIELV